MSTSRRVFLKNVGLATAGAGILTAHAESLFAARDLKFSLPRSKPGQQGISSAGVLAFLDAVEKSKIEFHSIMVVRHGHVVVEGWWAPYAPSLKHTLYSLSKSFTSTAVGLAISEGRFSLGAPVISFFPNDVPGEISDNLAAMSVQHLLTMSTGHAKDTIQNLRTAGDDNWVKVFLGLPVEHQPGTHFVYNTGATFMQSAIVQKVTGRPLQQYLKPRLFDPLSIEDYDWEMNPQGINTGGYGLRVKTEDIAKFGQLYLQKGKLDGVAIVPSDWVADATASHIDNSPAVRKRPKEEDDWSQGYGYQFWRCTHGAVRGDGAFGQFCIMMPEQDAVVVITGESFDLQASINLVWSHLLPAMKDSSLAGDDQAHKELQIKLKSLSIDPPNVKATAATATRISGKEFALDDNAFKAKSVSFRFSDNNCLLTVKDEKSERAIKCGLGKWLITENARTQTIFPIAGRPEVTTPLAASATWSDENTLMITSRFTATAHGDSIICQFAENKVTVKFLSSVSKGNPESPDKRPELSGRMTT